MAKYKIKQYTIDADAVSGKETIIDVNGCAVVHAAFFSDFKNFGFKVVSFIADDGGKIVDSGKNWSDVRTKARKYAKANFHRHIEHHNLKG